MRRRPPERVRVLSLVSLFSLFVLFPLFFPHISPLPIRLLLPLPLSAGSWVGPAQAASESPPPSVILISLDGTRPADVGPETLPSLAALTREGAVAERLIPVVPTNTFPNHVSLVTGVTPQRHGIVNNSFVDPERGAFKKKEIPEWIEVEPLWSILDRAGIVSASYHWVGPRGPGGVTAPGIGSASLLAHGK